MKTELITIGMLVLDVLVSPVTPEFFERDSMHVRIREFPGGDALNVAINASALGISSRVVSAVGADSAGDWLLKEIQSRGVDASSIACIQGADTARSLVMIEPGGERHFLTSTDIFAEIEDTAITDQLLSDAKVLSMNSFYRMSKLPGEATRKLFARARRKGALTVLDTMICRNEDPFGQILPALSETDIFLPSYQEAKQITGETDPKRMADRIEGLGPSVFIVKLGEEGSFVADYKEKRRYRIPAFRKEKCVSTVGAGDAYCAGLIASLIRGKDLYSSALFASAAAGLTAGVETATGGIHSYEEVQSIVDSAHSLF